MGLETATLITGALTDVESARDYLALDSDQHDPWLTVLINEATGLIERRTRRRLKSRTYDGQGSNPAAFVLDGTGSSEIILPEWPATALSSARYRDANDLNTALSIVSVRFSAGGIVVLPNDVFPRGFQNIEIKATAGYLAGTHDSEIAALEHACKRLVQVLYQDWKEKIGRGTGITIQGLSVQFINKPLPADVEAIVSDFRRIL